MAKKKTGEKQANAGQFKPGASGNPKGRPKLGEALSEVVRSKWPPAKLVNAMGKHARSKNEIVAMRAKEWLAERGYGRVPHDVDMDVTAFGPEAQAMLGALAMSPHERRKRAEELKRKAAATAARPAAKPAPARDADE